MPDPGADGACVDLCSADGRVHASVDLTGGGLRLLHVDGVPLVEEHPAGSPVPAASGAVLFPWPNRVRDGRWSADGVEHQLTITEPERLTANHGLVAGRRFAAVGRAPESVTVRVEVQDEPGYPFHLRLDLTYRLLPDGIAVDAEVRTLDGRTAPCALGFHPYPRVGAHSVDALTLDVEVDLTVEVDDRLLPVAVHAVDPGRRPTSLAGVVLNDCWRSVPGPEGRHTHRLTGPDGIGVVMRAEPDLRWVQVYTCPDFPGAEEPRRAVAIEPMSAPPDALRSGTDLRWIAPGEPWTTGWSLRLLR
jgi:aldose 1-epimerase